MRGRCFSITLRLSSLSFSLRGVEHLLLVVLVAELARRLARRLGAPDERAELLLRRGERGLLVGGRRLLARLLQRLGDLRHRREQLGLRRLRGGRRGRRRFRDGGGLQQALGRREAQRGDQAHGVGPGAPRGGARSSYLASAAVPPVDRVARRVSIVHAGGLDYPRPLSHFGDADERHA
jgi:hypothetical protein